MSHYNNDVVCMFDEREMLLSKVPGMTPRIKNTIIHFPDTLMDRTGVCDWEIRVGLYEDASFCIFKHYINDGKYYAVEISFDQSDVDYCVFLGDSDDEPDFVLWTANVSELVAHLQKIGLVPLEHA